MPYTINQYNGDQVAVVADGTIDSTLDIKLIGKNYAGYGGEAITLEVKVGIAYIF